MTYRHPRLRRQSFGKHTIDAPKISQRDPSLTNIYAEVDHIQPIEYVPTPVTELLRDMKDLSSLILDLAYSAVLFNDEDLYGEVQRIEHLIDHKNHMLEFNIMLAVRNVSQAEDAHSLLHVAAAANRISDAAADIGSVVRRNLGFPRLISEIMQRTAERVARVRVKSDSPLLRLTVFEIIYKLICTNVSNKILSTNPIIT